MHVSTDWSDNIKRRSLAEEFEALKISNPSFFQRIVTAGVATNTKHEWFDQALAPVSTTINMSPGGINDTDAVITVVSSAGLAAGDIIYFEDGSLFDLAKIVTVDSGTQITVSRSYGGSTGAAHAHGSKISLHSRPKIEGSTESATAIAEPTLRYNHTQIFRRDVSVSGSASSIKNFSIDDLIREGIKQRMLELYWEMDKALLVGARYDAGTPASVARTAGGLLYYIDANAPAGLKVDASAGALTTGRINGVIEEIIKLGGNCNSLVMSTKQARKIAGLNSVTTNVIINVEQMATGAGIPAPSKFFGDLPNVITDLIVDNNVPDDKIFIVDTSKIKVVPMDKREISELDTTDGKTDAFTRRILGEYTFEIRNSAESHGIIYNLA